MMNNFYQEDLAYIHHRGFGRFAKLVGEQLLALLHDHGIDSGLVTDIGCGSGIWAELLLDSGYDVCGIDISPAMIELARANAPRGQFRQASAFDCDLPRSQVITALGEVLGYAAEGMPRDEQLLDLFRRAADHLVPGGLLIFDVIVVSGGASMDYRDWQAGEDWAVLIQCSEQQQPGQLKRNMTIFRQQGDQYRRTEEEHLVRVFNPEELLRMLTVAGFDAEETDHYGTYPLASRRLAFVARKQRDAGD